MPALSFSWDFVRLSIGLRNHIIIHMSSIVYTQMSAHVLPGVPDESEFICSCILVSRGHNIMVARELRNAIRSTAHKKVVSFTSKRLTQQGCSRVLTCIHARKGLRKMYNAVGLITTGFENLLDGTAYTYVKPRFA